MKNFFEYFEKEWIDSKNSLWFEGCAKQLPSTNNALESTNNCIKRVHTMRERFQLSVFLGKLANMLKNWSIDRRINAKPFVENIEPSSLLWQLTNEYISSKPKCRIVRKDSIYLMSSNTVSDKTFETYLKTFVEEDFYTFDNFDELVKMGNMVRKVDFNRTDWKSSACTCPAYFKHFLCKHIVSLAIKKKTHGFRRRI